MRQFFILLICLFAIANNTIAQNVEKDIVVSSVIRIDSLLKIQSQYIEAIYENMCDAKSQESYKLYPTQNVYNFLKLDTRTGRIDQVQWSLDEKKEFITSINRDDLSMRYTPSLFELYPTENMYQFILLDKSSGRCWHVQWGFEGKKRWIKKIY